MAIAADLPPKEGRLVKWSEQKDTSTKKIIFIHGANATGYWQSGEVRFDLKVRNLNWVGEEDIGISTASLAEIWFYNYDPNQPIDKIVNDLMLAIESCEDFNGSQIALVGHSQGGVVAYRLIQQNPDLIDGVVCLGAPILSTPLVFTRVLYEALKKVFKHIWNQLIPKFDVLSKGTEQLKFDYLVPEKLPDNVYLFAGSIGTMRIKWALTWPWNIDHYINLVDVVVNAGGNFFTGLKDDRQFLEITADLIEKSDWGNNGKWDKLNDGLVPVSSALAGATKTDDQHIRITDCDHSDLLSGKGDLTLDRMIFNCLVSMLDLKSQALAIKIDLPEETPDLSGIIRAESPLKQTRFAYVLDNRIHLTDANWQRDYVVPLIGECSSPEFNSKKLGMTFTWSRNGNSDIFLFDEEKFCAITKDGKNRSASFSPNGKWLTYQSGDKLMTYNFKSLKSYALVKGINLASPPIWAAEWLRGKVYFAHRNVDGKIDIYCVSPRWRRTRDISELTPIIIDAGVPHIIRGYLGGIISTQSEWGSNGNLISQRIYFISGMLKRYYSLKILSNSKDNGITPGENWFDQNILIETSQGTRFESVLFDRDYLQLYFVDKEEDGLSSIYQLDYTLITGGETPFEMALKEKVPGGSQLDINMLAD